MRNLDNPAVYVGTYHKYNCGSIAGAWVDLTEHDEDSFYDRCMELHHDEEDPEIMFQDYENFPRKFYGESGLDRDLWEYLDFIAGTHLDKELVDEAINYGIPISDIEDRYYGYFDTPEKFAEDYLEQTGQLSELPDWAVCYFDFEGYAERELRHEFFNIDGHYFKH